jgi:hypothetical protein
MILTVRPATQADAQHIGANLRDEDRREVETATGMAATAVVPASLYHSVECYTARRATPRGTVEDDPFVIFGVTPDPQDGRLGVVWLLCTDAVRGAHLSLLREAREWIAHWMHLYPKGLHNLVDSRNATHRRWLTLLGFRDKGSQPIRSVPFIHMLKDSSHV